MNKLALVKQAFAQEAISIERPDNYKIDDVSTIIGSGIQIALILAGLLTLVFLIWGGVQWILSGGDKAEYEKARGKITAALIGLIIVAASWAIMTLIGKVLGFDVFNFEIPTLY